VNDRIPLLELIGTTEQFDRQTDDASTLAPDGKPHRLEHPGRPLQFDTTGKLGAAVTIARILNQLANRLIVHSIAPGVISARHSSIPYAEQKSNGFPNVPNVCTVPFILVVCIVVVMTVVGIVGIVGIVRRLGVNPALYI
jgi:hypothetical protein